LAVVIGDLMALADGNEIVAAIALPRDLSLQGAIPNCKVFQDQSFQVLNANCIVATLKSNQ